MDMKIKENVNFNSFTFRKRVIEESLDLIGKKETISLMIYIYYYDSYGK